MPLTDTAIRSAKPTDKVQRLFDGGGLYLEISLNGSKLWRMKFRFAGKEKRLAFGVYPTVSLKEAREKREEAKKQIANGIDPAINRKAVKAAVISDHTDSFEVISREWFAKHSQELAPTHSKKILARLENLLFPFLGEKPIRQIEAPDILAAVQHVAKRGALETAHRLIQLCGQIFRYAIVTGRVKHDVSADLRGALPSAKVKHRATITDPDRIGVLLRAIDEYHGAFSIVCALKLAPLVFLRPGELRQGEWSEINLDRAEWRIPADKMKMRQLHIVPLSKQSIFILKELHRFTGHGRYLFPSLKTPLRPITDATLLSALRSLGFSKEEMCVHGFRGMASTLLNEQGYNRDWVERQLAHSEKDQVRAAYNYAEYLPERKRMMQEWADYLDTLRDALAVA